MVYRRVTHLRPHSALNVSLLLAAYLSSALFAEAGHSHVMPADGRGAAFASHDCRAHERYHLLPADGRCAVCTRIVHSESLLPAAIVVRTDRLERFVPVPVPVPDLRTPVRACADRAPPLV